MSGKNTVPSSRPLYEKKVEGNFQPYLEFYPRSGVKEPIGGVLVVPGGGYGMRAQHEAAPIAERFRESGFHAFVLQYRVAPSRFPAPQEDIFTAIRILRSMSKELKLVPDQIAVCGFSAGGHLAASAGTLADELGFSDARPDAMILAYPVINLYESFAHINTGKNLLGETCSEATAKKYSLENRVDDKTPPAFLWHTADDEVVPVKNSLIFFEALRKYGIRSELHVFPHGPHGLGLAPEDPLVAIWPALAATFLIEQCGFDNANA